ncbi:MAG TPA: hypothetical protein DDZ70_03480 [Firmicutes bacterium]|jgi:hypothetical protein|nr:hypothetical protein [Bacillota bacterium]
MPLETGIWRINDNTKPIRIIPTAMDFEKRLEDILEEDISIISEPRKWMIIGRQVQTAYSGRIDLLAIDQSGTIIILELKKDKSDREVVSQVLDYAAWVKELAYEDLATIFSNYEEQKKNGTSNPLETAFRDSFGIEIPEEINTNHEMVIVASELHPESERVVRYLQKNYGVPVNAVFFSFFKDGDAEYLSRSWLVEPSVGEELDQVKPKRWNGEYYASFGYQQDVVEAGMKYGFLVAGGGDWYARSLDMLNPGDRVWVHMGSGKGFCGVATVVEPRQPVDDFMVDDNGTQKSVLNVVQTRLLTIRENPDKADYAVRLKWIKKIPSYKDGIWEKGFLANQNSVARPTSPKWDYTVERLKTIWGI